MGSIPGSAPCQLGDRGQVTSLGLSSLAWKMGMETGSLTGDNPITLSLPPRLERRSAHSERLINAKTLITTIAASGTAHAPARARRACAVGSGAGRGGAGSGRWQRARVRPETRPRGEPFRGRVVPGRSWPVLAAAAAAAGMEAAGGRPRRLRLRASWRPGAPTRGLARALSLLTDTPAARDPRDQDDDDDEEEAEEAEEKEEEEEEEEEEEKGRGPAAPGGNGVITLYKKHLKLEDPTDACKIKLLSFGEKQSVSISKIQVQLRRVSADSSTSSPTLGSRIDLDRVQAMMESMGSKLSPGAQQLMNMIRFQQRNCVPFGEQLPSVLGKKEPDPFGDPEMRDGLQRRSSPMGDSDKMSVRHSPFKSSLTPGAVTEAFKTYFERHPQQFAGDCTEGPEILPPNSVCPQNDIKVVSALLQKKANANLPCLELLPFFQNLCSQVNHLRRGDKTKPQENCPKPSKEGSVNTGDEQQPVCSYLEKIISKNMELMEKKLMDYIDQRLYRLQEHIDEKVILLMDRLQNPSFTATRLTQGDYDSGERLSNGDR
uniref:Uncharacterized protein n=1 Tax=Ornithorhynchus anatinus TaxID=9258 RepID=A0A6I8NMF8_ORNAN